MAIIIIEIVGVNSCSDRPFVLYYTINKHASPLIKSKIEATCAFTLAIYMMCACLSSSCDFMIENVCRQVPKVIPKGKNE